MDSADAAAPLAAWASIRGYFTPATLFLVVNLVIGTIALTSRATQQRRRRGQQHLYYHDDGHAHGHYHLQQEPLHPHQQQQPAYGDHYYQQPLYAAPSAPEPLARTNSVLDRLRSFGLYRFRSGDFPPEYGAVAGPPNHAQDAFAPVEEVMTPAAQQPEAHYGRSRSEPAPAREERRPPASRMKKSGSEVRKAQVARAPARVVEAVAEDDSADARAEDFTVSFRREPSPLQQEYNYQEEYVPPPARPRAPAPVPAPAPAPLSRTPSVMYRLRSLGLYGFLAPEQPAAASIPATDSFVAPAAAETKQAHAHYDRSRSEPAPEQGKKEPRMSKSSSSVVKEEEEPAGADHGVDARADDFINKFRQQLQLQRLNSLLNYK